MIAEGFFDVAWFRTVAGQVRLWGIVLAAFALGLASVNLARFHVVRIARRTRGWHNNIVCFVVMFAFAVGGIAVGPKNAVYSFYFNNLYSPLSVATMALTIFFIATASFRAVTIRNAEAVGAQTFAHLLVILLIFISNVAYFARKGRGEKR
jgi:hypothetical protein